MKFSIVGAGLAGCTIARCLADRGHDVTVYERDKVGGLCRTEEFGGTLYEPYGPHILYTNSGVAWAFLQRFAEWKPVDHIVKAVAANGQTYDYPISRETAKLLECEHELSQPMDRRNFETVVTSTVGPTLYKQFIYWYTKKHWGVEPYKLSASLASRVELRDKPGPYRKARYSGYPVGGYTKMIKLMLDGIPVIYSDNIFHMLGGTVIFTGEIDRLMGHHHGALKYRSTKFIFSVTNQQHNGVAHINHCDNSGPETRQTFYKNIGGSVDGNYSESVVGYEFPRDDGPPMYPFPSESEETKYQQYLEMVVNTEFIPAGRLGLYKYMYMDDAVLTSMDIAEAAPKWKKLDVDTRLEFINRVRGRA